VNPQTEELVNALRREMETRRSEIDEPLKTIYFGGGTPSLLTAGQIIRLLDTAGGWDLSELEETTLEVNPDDVTTEWLNGIVTAGVNRLSIGIQSFNERILCFIGRRHTAQKAVDAILLARQAGIRNISIDLMYGIPGVTLEEWSQDIDMALDINPEHISAYHLTHEKGTPFESLASIEESLSVEEYLLLHNKLTEAGYEHYEISNFARQGYRSRHNSSYWHGEKYLGIGPSAHSFNGKTRRWRAADLNGYLSDNALCEEETLSPEQKYNELVMTKLRTSDGLRAKDIPSQFLPHFLMSSGQFVEKGLLLRKDDIFVIDPVNLLVSDAIIRELFV